MQWIHEGPFRPQNSFLDKSSPVFKQPCKDVGDFKECQIAAINGGCVNEPYKYTGPRERRSLLYISISLFIYVYSYL